MTATPFDDAPPAQDLRSVDLAVGGMTCASCVTRIERGLSKMPGVTATVNLPLNKAGIRYPDTVTTDDLIAKIVDLGYTATLPKPPAAQADFSESGAESADADGYDAHTLSLRQRMRVSVALAVPVIALSMIPPLQFTYWQWAALTLAAPVAVWGAWPFHKAAWTNLRHGAATMDTLVSVGVVAAFGWSLYALFLGTAGVAGMRHTFELTAPAGSASGNMYLEVAAGLTAAILSGRFFEARSRRRAGAALRALLELGAKDVAVLREGVEQRIPIDQLAVGDVFVVRPGEKVATDGVVTEGNSAIDASMLTGESVPAEVAPGDSVVGGCVNVGGRLLVRATRVGADTQLAQMAKLVEQAQNGKAAIARLADRISAVFVPIVILAAVVTLGFWIGVGAGAASAFSTAVAVLIIACPCGLGLAAPTALLVGTGRGAQLGILIKGPEVLESTRRVDTVVLDKTGTVTTGKMSLHAIHPCDGTDQHQLLRLAGALEHASEHPIAKAIATAATNRTGTLPPVSDFANIEGLGVTGAVDGHDVLVGRTVLLEQRGIALPATLRAAKDVAESRGRTAVVVAWDRQARGILVVADTVKSTSAQAISELIRLGLRPVLLTGDNTAAARAIAAEVGIDEVIAEVLPKDKLDVITRLQDKGQVVAMVGDGVNDAAALAQADLGLSMGTGTDVAIEAGDLTLVRGDLMAAVDAIRLSRRTLRTIKGNLFWAFAYNVTALPLAALGLLNPLIAGAAMAFSSVFVVSNSLRLHRFRPTPVGTSEPDTTAVLAPEPVGARLPARTATAPDDFAIDAARRVLDTCRPVAVVAAQLGLDEEQLAEWVAAERHRRAATLDPGERDELRQLRALIFQQAQDLEVLRRQVRKLSNTDTTVE
jgi:Cu+-exporting ATPase